MPNASRPLSPDLPIEDMDLTARPFCRLHRSGVRTVVAVSRLTEDHLRNQLGLKDRSVAEIKSKLSLYGLTLADSAQAPDIKTPE